MSRLNPLISIHYLGNKTDGCLNNQYLKFIIMHKTVSLYTESVIIVLTSIKTTVKPLIKPGCIYPVKK